MFENTKITSLQNSQVKQVIKLRDKRERDRTDTFLIEGYREITRALKGDVVFKTLFYSEGHFLGSNEKQLLEEFCRQGAILLELSPHVFDKISYRDRPDGLLGIAFQRHASLDALKTSKEPFLLVAESIEKPGNLGSILRSGDAAGIDALLLCDRCTDIHNPNVVRASVGTLFTVPVLEVTSQETIAYLKKNQIKIIAATPDAKEEYTAVDLTGGVAIAVGTEQLGLSKEWMDQADIQVKIPMHGTADSLNVAAATTLLLYEVLRQRCK